MSQERREHQRFSIRLAAEINFGDRQFTATTRDVSRGGCCVASSVPLPEDATVQLGLYLVVDEIEESSMPPLEVLASVQWAVESDSPASEERHVTGLQFVGMSPEETAWLEQVLGRTTA